jgi:hypothetical protein
MKQHSSSEADHKELLRQLDEADLKAAYHTGHPGPHSLNGRAANAIRALLSATPASDALRRLSEDVMRCIDASWKPGYARDYGNLGPILAEYIDDLRKSAIPAAFNAPAGWHPDEPDAPPPASAASFEAIRDAIAIRMSGHTISEHDGKAWDTFMFLLRAVKASECAVSETPAGGTEKVPEGWKLVPILSTVEMQCALADCFFAEGWMGEDVASKVRSECADAYSAMLAAAPSPDGNEESK